MNSDQITSHLKLRCVLGIACLAVSIQDLLAWAQFTSYGSGWLTKLAGGEWLEPATGLVLGVAGAVLAGPSLALAFVGRDAQRAKARRAALGAALLAGLGFTYAVESLVPSTAALPLFGDGRPLAKESRRSAVIGLTLGLVGLAGFLAWRRKDVGFESQTLRVERSNDIWKLTLRVELAFRALAENEEAYHMVAERVEFIKAEVGAKFDQLCEPLVKESANLATIDSTARLQLDVGHVFKRYADFHRRLAETRHHLGEDIRKAAYDAVANLLEHQLPGQGLSVGPDSQVKISIAHPVLTDTPTLQRRRAEWDSTLRSVVTIGAETGNQIIGDWIDRAARGEISQADLPGAVQALRALCQNSNRASIGYAAGEKALALSAS
jgi:hypothetical protein